MKSSAIFLVSFFSANLISQSLCKLDPSLFYEPGYEWDYQLPRDWNPITYRLNIDYTVSATQVPARVKIEMRARRPTKQIVLNAFQQSISIQNITLKTANYFGQLTDGTVDQETITYQLPEVVANSTTHGMLAELFINYTFMVNTTSKYGPYRSDGYGFDSYSETNNGTKVELVTQFEPFYARRMLPCFDEPEFKAVFYLDSFKLNRQRKPVSTFMSQHAQHNGTVVLFNTHGVRLSKSPFGEVWTFPEPTPKMAPYLLALLVGYFTNAYKDGTLGEHPPMVTYWFDKTTSLNDTVLKTRDVIQNFEQKFDLQSPVKKTDFAFIPTNFGGMENWGLITMNNMYDPSGETGWMSSYSGESVIVHEILHQWFGNFITCRWWKDIWIHEGLTSYFTNNYMENIFKPDTEAKKYKRSSVMWSDNHPIRLERFGGGWTMSYEKTPWIMNMLEKVMGPENFLEATKQLLHRYKFDSVTSDDFFTEFQNVATKRNIKGWDQNVLDVRTFLYNWIFKAGFPTVAATWNNNVEGFNLSQSTSGEVQWYIPIWFTVQPDVQGENRNISGPHWVVPGRQLSLGEDVEITSENYDQIEWDPLVVGYYVIETITD